MPLRWRDDPADTPIAHISDLSNLPTPVELQRTTPGKFIGGRLAGDSFDRWKLTDGGLFLGPGATDTDAGIVRSNGTNDPGGFPADPGLGNLGIVTRNGIVIPTGGDDAIFWATAKSVIASNRSAAYWTPDANQFDVSVVPSAGKRLLIGGDISGTVPSWIQVDSTHANFQLPVRQTGQAGAATATRYIGGTAGAIPSTVGAQAGDWAVDTTGTIWVYNGATWRNQFSQLPPSNGADDTATIDAALAASHYVRGLPGQTYLITNPIQVPTSTTLDMSRCTVQFANTGVKTNMVQNAACTPDATATDVTTTAASSVITSPQLIAAGAAVNHKVGVVAAGVTGGNVSGPSGRLWMYGTITAIAGNNITLGGNINGVAASVSLANATAYLFKSRDKDVTVIGGIWDAGTNWNVLLDRYNAAYNSNLLRFRRCDGVTVRDVKLAIDVGYQTSGDGWCFGVNPADCTDILIEHCGSAPNRTAPTVVNTSGMISRLIVRDTFGTTYDDHVAVGTVGASFDDVEGDIVDVLIDGVMVNGSLRAVDLYCGQGSNGAQRFLTGAKLRSIKGTILTGTGSAAAPIQITNYAGNAQIAVDLDDITVFKVGSGGFRVSVATGQAGITVTGPNPGADLVEATITANAATGINSTPADIVTASFTAPPSGQVWLEAGAYSVGQGTTAGNLIAYITDNSNTVLMQQFLGNVAAGGFSPGPSLKAKVTQLVPGTNYTFKFRASTSVANAGNVLAGATFPAFLRATVAA